MRTKLLFIGLVLLMFLPLVSAETLIQFYSPTTLTNITGLGRTATNSYYIANDFVMNSTANITGFQMQFSKAGAPTGQLWAAIYNVNASGFPIGLIANTTTTVDVSTLTSQWVGFNLTSYITLNNTGRYAMVVGKTTGLSATDYVWSNGAAQAGFDSMQALSTFTGWANDASNQAYSYRLYQGTITPAATNITFTAYNAYSSQQIQAFCVNITGNYTCTTNGTATVTTILTNSSQLWTVEFRSNESSGYFNQTYTGVNVSTNYRGNLTQVYATFYATDLITGANLTGGQFLVNSLSNSTVNGSEGYVFNLSAGSYNVTYAKNGYYTKTSAYNFTALSSNTNTITGIYNQSLNVTAYYLLNGSSINSFTVTITNSTYGYNQSYNVTNGVAQFNLSSGIQYNVLVNITSGTFGNSTTFTSTLNATTFNVSLISTTQFNLFFFDENTLQPVYNVNYTIVGATYAFNGSTSGTSNNVNFTGLSSDNYEIRYTQNGGNYTYRSYFITVPLTSPSMANLSLYMLTTSNATSFTLTVTDTYNQPKAGFTVSLLRRYAINGATTYYVVEMMQPSVALQGVTPFVAIANTIPYIFRVTDSSGTVLFQGAGTSSSNLDTLYLISSAIYIKVQTEYSVLQPSVNFQGLSTTLTNTSTAVQLTWADTSYTLSRICIYMYGNTTTLLGTSCSAASQYSGTITYTYNPVNGTVYSAFVYATSSLDGKQYLIGNPFVDDRRTPTTSPGWGTLGVFFVIVLMMIVGISFADRPSVAILIGSITMFAFFTVNAFGKIITLPTATSAILGSSFLVIGIIIMVSLREEF